MKINHIGSDRDKRLLFRGWSRICIHAASIDVAEGATVSAASYASTRRDKAVEREADADIKPARTWNRAAALGRVEAAEADAAADAKSRGDAEREVAQEQRNLRAGRLVRAVRLNEEIKAWCGIATLTDESTVHLPMSWRITEEGARRLLLDSINTHLLGYILSRTGVLEFPANDGALSSDVVVASPD